MGKVLEHYEPMMTMAFGNGHIGIDIVGLLKGAGALDGILAFEKGTIEAIESNCAKVYNNVNDAIRDWGHSYGCYVLLNHGTINGHTYKTRYAHLQYRSNCLLKVGQVIQKGQGIGEMGNTGCTDGGHLHFEIIKDGKVIDPYDFVFKGKELQDDVEISLPKPVKENRDVRQVEVICGENTLRVRTGHNTKASVIGFAKPGIYNIVSIFEDGTYVWYEVEKGKWFASAEGCTRYIPAIDEEPVIDVLEPIPEEKEEEQSNTLPSTETAENKANDEGIEVRNKDKESVLIWLIKIIVKIVNEMFKKN